MNFEITGFVRVRLSSLQVESTGVLACFVSPSSKSNPKSKISFVLEMYFRGLTHCFLLGMETIHTAPRSMLVANTNTRALVSVDLLHDKSMRVRHLFWTVFLVERKARKKANVGCTFLEKFPVSQFREKNMTQADLLRTEVANTNVCHDQRLLLSQSDNPPHPTRTQHKEARQLHAATRSDAGCTSTRVSAQTPLFILLKDITFLQRKHTCSSNTSPGFTE